MAQNMYDNETFFQEYSRLKRSVSGLEGAPEWPSLRAMLPGLQGSRVLDLGCGFGWFSRWASQHGAAQVLGIDLSEKMLARAAEAGQDEKIAYRREDLEQLKLTPDAFDLVYSSLAFHYLENLERLMAEIYRSLVPGGSLVFSVEHPIYTAPSNPGWVVDAAGRQTWPVDGYQLEGPRSTDWLAPGVIKQHRTFATYLNMLLRLGFTLCHVEEWSPTQQQIASWPELAEELQRPTFLLVCAMRR